MLLGSLLLTLVVLEGAARILHLGSGGFWEPDPLYGWRNIPNASGWESCYGECAVFVKINSLGLRDNETPYQPAPTEQRILLLGDSMTAGMQVPLDDTFGKVLGAHLNASLGTSDWHVINAAVNGFGTDNELLLYRFEGAKYQAQYVVVGVYLANDVYNNDRMLELSVGGNGHKPYFDLNAEGQLELHNFPTPDTDSPSVRLGTFLKRYFQLPRFLAEVLRLRHQVPEILQPLVHALSGDRGVQEQSSGQAASDLSQGDICSDTYTPEVARAWRITKALIKELETEIAAQGSQLIVVTIPASPQITPPGDGVSWYCDRPNQELSDYLAAEGIPDLDLLTTFRDYALQGGPPLYYSKDFHMNVNGHRLAGEALAAFMINQVIVDTTGDQEGRAE